MHICATRWQHCYAHGKRVIVEQLFFEKSLLRNLGKDNSITAIIHSLSEDDPSILLITFWKLN